MYMMDRGMQMWRYWISLVRKNKLLKIVRQKATFELNISFEKARKHYAHWMPVLNEGDDW